MGGAERGGADAFASYKLAICLNVSQNKMVASQQAQTAKGKTENKRTKGNGGVEECNIVYS